MNAFAPTGARNLSSLACIAFFCRRGLEVARRKWMGPWVESPAPTNSARRLRSQRRGPPPYRRAALPSSRGRAAMVIAITGSPVAWAEQLPAFAAVSASFFACSSGASAWKHANRLACALLSAPSKSTPANGRAHVFREEQEVNARLAELELKKAKLLSIRSVAVAAAADATPFHPANAAGNFSYQHGTFALRKELAEEGWVAERPNGVEAIRNQAGDVRVAFANVDVACNDEHEPRPRSGKGAGAERLCRGTTCSPGGAC